MPVRMALLSVGTIEQRHAPMCASVFGVGLDAVVCHELGVGDRPAVELVQWTGKCDYMVQFSARAWSRVNSNGR